MTHRRFEGGMVVLDGELRRADVTTIDGHIAEVTTEDSRSRTAASEPDAGSSGTPDVIDCEGLIVAPGYIDLQCNGAGGFDLTGEIVDGPEVIGHVAEALPRFGVTSFLPTVVTSPREVRDAAREAIRRARPGAPGSASPLGLHFEGPMISRDHLGAHADELATSLDDDEIDEWIADDTVALVTLSPEFSGAVEVVRRLSASGVVVSAGHTGASPSEFDMARRSGLSYVTHLFNAMAPFDHRNPGPIGAVLGDPTVTAGLICDGIHVDPVTVRMAWRSLGPSRLSLVSDAAAPLGAPFGTFDLGRRKVRHDTNGVRTTDGTLAGSALALDQAVRNLVEFTDCSFVDAIATVTTTPADLLGLTDRGRITTGAHADLTILTPDGQLVATVIGGDVAWKS